MSEAERRERFEKLWASGDLVGMLTQLWPTRASTPTATRCSPIHPREDHEIVKDPETAQRHAP